MRVCTGAGTDGCGAELTETDRGTDYCEKCRETKRKQVQAELQKMFTGFVFLAAKQRV